MLLRFSTSCLLALSFTFNLCAAEPPEFIGRSTAPAGIRVRIEGFTALIIPDTETAFGERGPAYYVEKLSSLFNGQAPEKSEALIKTIDEKLFESRGHWQKFELAEDGEKLRYRLFDQSGQQLTRDVAFNGKTEVQYMTDSDQANVFLKRSNVSIPSFSNFFPLSAAGAKMIPWTETEKSAMGEVKNTRFTAVPTADGYIKSLEQGSSHTIVAAAWKKSDAGFSIPTVLMKVTGSGDKTDSITLKVVDSCQLSEPLTPDDLAVAGYAGTRVFLGGLGATDYGSYKLLEDVGDLASSARQKFSVPE